MNGDDRVEAVEERVASLERLVMMAMVEQIGMLLELVADLLKTQNEILRHLLEGGKG